MRYRLGLLAVAQGNGEVSILSIPIPEEALLQRDRLSKGKRPAASESAADRLINMAPCASAQPVTLSGSLASCVEWLPSAPHDLLLVRGLLRALSCIDGQRKPGALGQRVVHLGACLSEEHSCLFTGSSSVMGYGGAENMTPFESFTRLEKC